MDLEENEILKAYDKAVTAGRYQALTDELFQTIKCLNLDEFKIQNIQPRKDGIKSRASVIRKIKEKAYSDISEMTDLAGVRVIFYYEDNIDGLINALRDKVTIIKSETRDRDSGYFARHLIVELKDGPNKGLKAEIQLVSVMKHAWAEVTHDVTYHDEDGLKEFDEYSMNDIENEFKEIASEISDLDLRFEALRDRANAIKDAKGILTPEFFFEAESASDYDVLFKKLDSLNACLSRFAHRAPKQTFEFLNKVIELDGLTVTERETLYFGTTKGKTHQEILNLVCECAGRLRYVSPKESLQVLQAIYEKNGLNECLKKGIETLFKYDVTKEKDDDGKDVLRFHYGKQKILLEELNELKNEEFFSNLDFYIEAIKHMVDLEYRQITQENVKSFRFGSGGLKTVPILKDIRKFCFDKLFELYKLGGPTKKTKILSALQHAIERPNSYDDELRDMLMEDIDLFIDFLHENSPETESPAILLEIEQTMVRQQFMYKNLDKAKTLILKLRSYPNYSIYRRLVGEDYLSDSLDDDDLKQSDTSETPLMYFLSLKFDEQIKLLKYLSETYDLREDWEFSKLRTLIFNFAKEMPSEAAKIYRKLDAENTRTAKMCRLNLLRGIRYAGSDEINELDETNIQKQTYERTLLFLRSLRILDEKLNEKCVEQLEKLAQKIESFKYINDFTEDEKSVLANEGIFTTLVGFKEESEVQKKLVLEFLKNNQLNENDTLWVLKNMAYQELDFSSWTDDELQEIQNLFVNIHGIQDFHIQRQLAKFIDISPLLGRQVFEKRHERKKETENFGYSVVPHEFYHELSGTLKRNGGTITQELLDRYFNNEEYQGYISDLLEKTANEKEVVEILKKKVAEGKVSRVIDFMRDYGLSEETISLAIELANTETGKDRERLISFIVHRGASGSGDFGLEKAYQRRLDHFNRVAAKVEKTSKEQKTFIEDVQTSLQSTIDHHHTEALKDIKTMERNFKS